MNEILELWRPILLSAVFVFVASAIIWMASPLHKHDYKDPGDKEGPILDMIKKLGLSAGVYYVPWCKGKEKDPASVEKMKNGPWAMVTVMGKAPNFGMSLGLWFVHLLIVGVMVAYVTHLARVPGDPYLKVFQVSGATALMAHAGYSLPMCIWHGQPWSQLFGRILDGVVYALLTAGVFGWLWPVAAVVVK